jgi:hypothetical protein
MSRFFAVAFAAASVCASAASAAIFSENFDDGMAATRWSVPVVDAELGVFDGTLSYNFDYSTLGVPSAPRSGGTTTGLFMEVNLTDVDAGSDPATNTDEGESVGITSNVAAVPAGDFKLSMDVYFNVDNNFGGTTEYGLFGVYAVGANDPADAGLNDDVPFRFGVSDGDGLAFSATGDGGAAQDFVTFSDPGNLDAGTQRFSLLAVNYDNIPDGSIPGVPTGTNNFPKFGPEDQWVDISIESAGGIISFKMNGFTLDTFDNTSGIYTGGKILLGYSDAFNSSSRGRAHWLLVDNVTLVPEPATWALVAGSLAGLAVVRRRRVS